MPGRGLSTLQETGASFCRWENLGKVLSNSLRITKQGHEWLRFIASFRAPLFLPGS
jgi:hypothetical protein